MTIDDKENRLEQALSEWEDLEFALYHLRSMMIALPEEPELQELLAVYQNPALSPNQIASVRGDLLQAVTSVPGNGALVRDSFPRTSLFHKSDLLCGLHGWSRCSRRIYRVPGDLQLLLEATQLTGLWTDVKLPFDAYAVLLEEPLELEDGRSCDVVLFYRHGQSDAPSYQVTLFPQSLAAYKPLDSFTRTHVMRAVRQKDAKKLLRLLSPFFMRTDTLTQTLRIDSVPLDQIPEGTSVSEGGGINSVLQGLENTLTAQGQIETTKPFLNAFRIAIGLGLYLSTLPAIAARPHSPWTRLSAQRGNPRVVTDRAQVCQVQSTRTLSLEDREVFRRHRNKRARGYEATPHPRDGYWSRPPGKGSDPTAEKTVWHEPTIVRRDLLPDGALPLGSAVTVITKKKS